MQRPTFSVTSRFALVLVITIPSLAFLGWKGTDGLASTRRLTDTLFNDIITTQRATADMVTAMSDVHTTALAALAVHTPDPAQSRALIGELANTLIPRADADLEDVRELHVDDGAAEKRSIADLTTRWHDARALWNSMAVDPPPPALGIDQLDASFSGLSTLSRALVARESTDGHAEYSASQRAYNERRRNILAFLSIALIATIAAVAWLYRGVLPRTRRYSRFAERVAAGDGGATLDTRGRDELAVLGKTLVGMATRRTREQNYDVSQSEFAETMQLSANEGEAHRMLKRHLERSIDGSDVVIMNRNNSQDRLEAVTDLAPGSAFAAALDGAEPRACIAVRQARTHRQNQGEDPLLQCAVCAGRAGRSTCTPFLVGGEVIGSVLLSGARDLGEEQTRRIRDSVVQAAPVLANLRNLAIAETRAATDSLTGLPNRRSVDANLMRMVAHAGRSIEPIAVMLLDLDHFKMVNDRFGHAGGDEILAAVGAAIRATVRESDFAGRYGGEEFIVVLPNTGLEGAANVAELIRRAIAEIVVPSVDQSITVSAGVAVLPEHASDSTSLVRAADRALYVAKSSGRDRVECARTNTPTPARTP